MDDRNDDLIFGKTREVGHFGGHILLRTSHQGREYVRICEAGGLALDSTRIPIEDVGDLIQVLNGLQQYLHPASHGVHPDQGRLF